MSQPVDVLAAAFQDELVKIASEKQKRAGAGKVLLPMVAGAAGFELLRRANQDRRMGRAMRAQQGSY